MSGEASRGPVRFGVFEVDTQAGELRRNGSRIRLRYQPFQVLVLLLEHPGTVVSRERIQCEIWPEGTFVDFDRGLNKAVNHLRDALGDSAENPRFIETIPKRGYRFIAAVENSPSAPGTSEPEDEIPAVVQGRPKIWWLAVLAIPLSIWIGIRLFHWDSRSPGERSTIILADFTNLTGDSAFDLTLRQALEIDLAQSPFLKILSDQQVRDTVALMERGGEQPLTRQVAREVCLRTGGKAVVDGSIALLGSEYVLGLSVIGCLNGETLAQEQMRVHGKEEILHSLDTAASGIRRRLGESLDSIRRFDRPLTDFVSTSSLEAFQAYVRGQQAVQQKGRVDGIPFYLHAAELDPNFALAHLQLGLIYGFLGEQRQSTERIRRAYGLRGRVSEVENFMTSAQYYLAVTEELDRALSICQVWIRSYPEDGSVYERTSWAFMKMGQFENARVESQKARDKRGDLPISINQLARSYLFTNQIESARAIFEHAATSNPNQLFWHEGKYLIGFYDGDAAHMEEQVAWGTRTPGAQDSLLSLHSATNEYFGRMRLGRELSQLAVEFAKHNDFNERAALFAIREALNEALIGNTVAARLQVYEASKLASDPERNVRALAALTLARIGDAPRASHLADELASQFPSSTLVQKYWLPSIRAEIALSNGNYRGAIEALQGTEPYDLADTPAPLIPVYVRAEALLAAGQGTGAATEFQKILRQRGMVGNSMLSALGHLGLARAYSLSNEESNARSSYQDFFTLWKEADHDIPLLVKARAEFAALK